MPSYPRAPSEAFRRLLTGPLASLLERRLVAGSPVDPQLRDVDVLSLYVGCTAVLSVRLVGEEVELSTHRSYGAALFEGARSVGEYLTLRAPTAGLGERVGEYLDQVKIKRRFLENEGAVQSAWSRLDAPWMSLDREAQITYASREEQRLLREAPAVAAASAEVQALAAGWAPVPPPNRAAKLDRLAVDPEGRLVLVELKDPAESAGLYYAPLQLLQYVWEWHRALGSLREGLEALRLARVELGLSPGEIPAISAGIRPVLAWGEGRPRAEVGRRLQQVLAVANRHRPEGVLEMELWGLRGGGGARH